VKKSQLGNNLILAIASLTSFLIIGGPILLCLGAAVLFSSCKSERPKPEEIELSRYVPGESDHCPYAGEIVRIEDLIGSNEALGGSGLVVIQVQPDPPVSGKYLAAIASKHDNFSVGDRIVLCRVMVSHMHGFNTNLKSILITRKIPNYSYENPGVQTLEQCQGKLEKCNEKWDELELYQVRELCQKDLAQCRKALKHCYDQLPPCNSKCSTYDSLSSDSKSAGSQENPPDEKHKPRANLKADVEQCKEELNECHEFLELCYDAWTVCGVF